MQYDAERKSWTFVGTALNRSGLILDVDHYFVWAMSKDGGISEPSRILVRWLFPGGTVEEAETAMKSHWTHVREAARLYLVSSKDPKAAAALERSPKTNE